MSGPPERHTSQTRKMRIRAPQGAMLSYKCFEPRVVNTRQGVLEGVAHNPGTRVLDGQFGRRKSKWSERGVCHFSGISGRSSTRQTRQHLCRFRPRAPATSNRQASGEWRSGWAQAAETPRLTPRHQIASIRTAVVTWPVTWKYEVLVLEE